jgi:hypothetical protein
MGGAPAIKVSGTYTRPRNYVIEGYAPAANFGAMLLPVDPGMVAVDLVDGDGGPDSEAALLDYLAGLTPETAALPRSTAQVLLAPDPDPDDQLTGDLAHYLGKPTPDWSGSFGGSVKFLSNFTVSTLFEYKTGNYHINNLTDAFRNANALIGLNTPAAAEAERNYITGGLDASGNPLNDPQVRLDALEDWIGELLALAPFPGLNTIKKADFLRWREVSLTYNAPRTFVEGFGIRSLAFTVAGRNLASRGCRCRARNRAGRSAAGRCWPRLARPPCGRSRQRAKPCG